jgi:hypothetical protein
MEESKTNNAIIIKVNEIGLSKKVIKSPPDIIKERRKESSIRGPKTSAKTNGGVSKLNFLQKYPINPKKTIIYISDMLFFKL